MTNAVTISSDAGAPPASQKCQLHPSKRRYQTAEHAWEVADRRSAEAKLKITPYRCPSCSDYHLTSSPRNEDAPPRRPLPIRRIIPADPPPGELSPAEADAALRRLIRHDPPGTRYKSTDLAERLGVKQKRVPAIARRIGLRMEGTTRAAEWVKPGRIRPNPPADPPQPPANGATSAPAAITPPEGIDARPPADRRADRVLASRVISGNALDAYPLETIRTIARALGYDIALVALPKEG